MQSGDTTSDRRRDAAATSPSAPAHSAGARARCGPLRGLGCSWALAGNALHQTWSEIRKAPCTYCIGVSSVLLVVIVAAVVTTLISKAPLIFLREAENSAGQIDLQLVPDPDSSSQFLNYTQFAGSIALGPASTASYYQYHASRLSLPGDAYGAAQCLAPGSAFARGAAAPASAPNGWMYTWPVPAPPGTRATGSGIFDCGRETCLPAACADAPVATGIQFLFLDTAAEASMSLGRAWGFGALAPGEVVVPQALATKLGGLQAGDTLYAVLRADALVSLALAPALSAPGSPVHGADAVGWPSLVAKHPLTAVPFVVAAVADNGLKGKVGRGDGSATIIGELAGLEAWLPGRVHPLLQAVRAAAASHGAAGGWPTNMTTVAAAVGGSGSGGVVPPPPSRPLAWYSSSIVANLPPSTRISAYSNSNYDRLRATVADYASSLLYLAGFTETDASTPLLSQLEPRRFITLYLGLLLDVLLIILFALAVILIYALLLVNAESRTFELAVRRMLGSRRYAIIYLLLTQAAAYGVPAWIAGLIIAQIMAAGLARAFTNLSSIPVSQRLTGSAIGAATALALAIPAVASIGPIRTALKSTIRDALDTGRPKATAIQYKLTRSDDGLIKTPMIIIGVCLSVFGFGLYYGLPLALLSGNLSLFFNLFLAIIVGMLAGLILLSLNLELPLLGLAQKVTISWWERAAISGILWSNLSAGHRTRNRKTVIMYALSIAFIVFIAVAATAQIQSATYTAQSRQGAPLASGPDPLTQTPSDPAMMAAVEQAVREVAGDGGPAGACSSLTSAWATAQLSSSMGWLATVEGEGGRSGQTLSAIALRNVGRSSTWGFALRGISPRFYGYEPPTLYPSAPAATGATYSEFLSVEHGPQPDTAAAPLSRLLATTSGSQGLLLSNNFWYEISVGIGDDAAMQTTSVMPAASTVSAATTATGGAGAAAAVAGFASGGPLYSRSRAWAAAMLAASPAFLFTRGPSTATTALSTLLAFPRILDDHSANTAVATAGAADVTGGALAAGGLPRVAAALPRQVWRTIAGEAVAAGGGGGVDSGVVSALVAAAAAPATVRASAAASTSLLAAGTAASTSADPATALASSWRAVAGNITTARGLWAAVQRASTRMPLQQSGGGQQQGDPAASAAADAAYRSIEALYTAMLLADDTPPTPVDAPLSTGHVIAGVSVADVPVSNFFINAAAGAPASCMDAAKAAAGDAITRVRDQRAASWAGRAFPPGYADNGEWGVRDMSDSNADLATTVTLLELFFAVLALVAMVLCFFSLLASMVTNIQEQQREIGVLLALGLRAHHLIRVYVHEAFLLVLVSSLLGTGVGCVIAWTFGQQQSLFTGIPVPFTLPWGILAVVVIASIVASILAACLPARRLTLQPITKLLRGA